MRKRSFTTIMASAAVLGLLLNSCNGHSDSQRNSTQTLQGVAASGAPIAGTITLKDAAVPSQVMTTTSAANGSFSFNTSGLTQPFMLSVSWTDNSGINQLFSFASGPGTANINPFSNAVFAASAGVYDLVALFNYPDPNTLNRISSSQASISDSLRSKLAPLLQRYGTAANPITDVYNANHTGLDAMFDDVKITVTNGQVMVTTRQTGAVIFTSPISDIASGTFNDINMPGGTGVIDGTALYANNCSVCHSPLATSTVSVATAAAIQAAIKSIGTMTSLSNLFALQIQAIATALTSTPTSTAPSPTTCTYTYGAWSACESNNTQTRIVLTTTPAGCTGTPVVSQTCTYTPPPACIYTYSDWGACWLNNMQTRKVLTTAPASCAGTPLLSQSCVYTPPPSTLTQAQVTTTCTACHGLIVNNVVLGPPPFPGGSTYIVTGRSAFDWWSTVNAMTGQGAVLAPGTTVENYANFLAALP